MTLCKHVIHFFILCSLLEAVNGNGPWVTCKLATSKASKEEAIRGFDCVEIDIKRQKTEEVQAVVCLSQDLLLPGVKCSLGKLSSPPVI